MIKLEGYKRFTDLTISVSSEKTKLVILTGPNGSGKSSVFDAMMYWHRNNSGKGYNWKSDYNQKGAQGPTRGSGKGDSPPSQGEPYSARGEGNSKKTTVFFASQK